MALDSKFAMPQQTTNTTTSDTINIKGVEVNIEDIMTNTSVMAKINAKITAKVKESRKGILEGVLTMLYGGKGVGFTIERSMSGESDVIAKCTTKHLGFCKVGDVSFGLNGAWVKFPQESSHSEDSKGVALQFDDGSDNPTIIKNYLVKFPNAEVKVIPRSEAKELAVDVQANRKKNKK